MSADLSAPPLLLDTHVLIWLAGGEAALGDGARETIDRAFGSSTVLVSAISFWEVAMLQARGRIDLKIAPDTWRRRIPGSGVSEIPVDGAIGIHAAGLEDFHGDPADRLIVASARYAGAGLVTADRAILDWPGDIERIPARR